jgi:hypothetical protein
MPNPRRALALFAVGAVVGTLGDRIHTHYGVLGYPRVVAFGEAWFVPFLMGGAGIALVSGQALVRRALSLPAARATGDGRAVVTAFAWFACAYFASGVFQNYPVALTVAFVGAFLGRALGRVDAPGPRGSAALFAGALLTAVGGSLFESALSATGAFAYAMPDALGVPIWLPGLYLHAAMLARAIDRRWPPAEQVRA